MSGETFLRLLTSLHGQLGILASVALLHPAILLRRGRPLSRGLRWALGLSVLTILSAYGLGLSLYEDYRERVKRDLFALSYDVGYLFESKEHLAFAAMALALGGAGMALLAPKDAPRLRQIAAALFALASALTFVVVALGLWVSAHGSF